MPQEDIDNILRFGSNTRDSRMRVAAEFMKQKSPKEISVFLQQEYHGGYGIKGTDGDISVWYAGDGIHLYTGRSARYADHAQVISWDDAAARINELMEKLGFTIHNYFAAKILDEVRPGGIAAFLTSRYTMDARDTSVREYLAQRADLLGAIRLPNNAFKANAGTEVVTDILFFQKREAPMEELPPWIQVGETEDGLTVNSYFIDHPEMVLGTLTHDDRMYGDRNDITCEPIPGADLTDQLHEAISHIHGQYRAAEAPELNEGQKSADIIPADPTVKNFSFTVVSGEVYYREDSIMARPELNATAKERVKALVELRECVRELIDLQTDDALDSKIRAQQDRLNSLYDAFANKYGLPELQELVSLLRRSSGNLNQIAKRVNFTGRIYDTDMEELLQSQERLWAAANDLLTRLTPLK